MRRIILKNNSLFMLLQQGVTGIFFVLMTFFFCFKYNYHLIFAEQLQIFQFTSLYLKKYLAVPGGISAYAGEFFTQFYHINRLGGFILVLYLFVIYLLHKFFLNKWRMNKSFTPLLLLPCIAFFLCYLDVNACLGGAISVLFALLISIGFLSIKNDIMRWSIAPVAIMITYWICGGSIFVFGGLICINEFRISTKKSILLIVALYIACTVSIPLFVRQNILTLSWNETWIGPSFYNIQTVPGIIYVILFIPLIILSIILLLSNISWTIKQNTRLYCISLFISIFFLVSGYIKYEKITQEEIFELDFYARNEDWDKIISVAQQKKRSNSLFVSYTNLALAKKGRLSADMFNFFQMTDANTFWTPDYYPTYITGEVYYSLDLVQIARAFFLMANTQSPKSQFVHLYKRLAEVELLTGNFELAEKYIHTLRQTLFYKKLAEKLEQIMISKNFPPELIQKKRNQPKNDGFFAMEFKYNLLVQYSENKENFFAYDYLMMELMLENDFTSFIQNIDQVYPSTWKSLPVSYQQFLIMYAYLIKDNLMVIKYRISPSVIQTFNDYMQINQQNLSSDQIKEQLREKYGNTYWYYAQYINKIKK